MPKITAITFKAVRDVIFLMALFRFKVYKAKGRPVKTAPFRSAGVSTSCDSRLCYW